MFRPGGMLPSGRAGFATRIIAIAVGAAALAGGGSPAGAATLRLLQRGLVRGGAESEHQPRDANPVSGGRVADHTQLRALRCAGAEWPRVDATLRVFANDALPAGFEVRSVSNNTWGEATITYNNAPAMSPAATSLSRPVAAAAWRTVDVTSLVGGNGLVTLGLATSSPMFLGIGSRESATPPELVVTTVGGLTVVSRSGNTYLADSQSGGSDYSGPQLKVVVENAMDDLDEVGGGLLSFQPGTFDLGADHLQLTSISNVTFDGQGIDVTNVVNNTNVLQDTEPFSSLASDHITIRNMTISAGGSLRETSDAVDFDGGDFVLIDRVKINASRARGIVFDGKDAGADAIGNAVRHCTILGVPSEGVELLAASFSRVEGCTITNTGGHGVQVTKSSPIASQPNKKSTTTFVAANTIQGAEEDGVQVLGSARNQVLGNSISGERVTASASIPWIRSCATTTKSTATRVSATRAGGLTSTTRCATTQ